MELDGQNTYETDAKRRAIVLAEASSGRPSEDFQKMARRRFQGGSVFLRGTRDPVWVGRWREDVIGPDQKVKRVGRKEILGTKKDFPTKKLALRELGIRLAPINRVGYRALRVAKFAEFAAVWQNNVLTQHKPSTQAAIRSQLRVWLRPFFGDYAMKDIGGQVVQMFVQSCDLSPRTCRNYILTLRMMWNSAKAWGYVMHNPFDGLVLPKVQRQMRFFFT